MTVLTKNTDFYDILKTYTDAESLTETLSPAKINIIKTDDCRLFFNSNTYDTSVSKYKVRYQARGVVLDELEHVFLSIPSLPLNYYENINKEQFKTLYESDCYNIIQARDGTNVTLYNFNGVINMSTGRSYDISNYYWSGNQTFAQMFYEAAETNSQFIKDTQLKIAEDGHVRWNVPENYCVTLGFRHHNIHQNLNDKQDIWLVRAIDRIQNKDVIIPQLSNLKQNIILEEKLTLEEILKKCSRDQFLDQRENFYGYIFKSKNDNIDLDLDRVFLPSTLYKTLQYFFYSFYRNKKDVLTHENRYLYSIFKNILMNNDDYMKLLFRLHPIYSSKIQNYKNFIDLLISKCCSRFEDSTYGEITIFRDFINKIVTNIKKDESDIEPNSTASMKIINDYVKDHNNTKEIVDLYIKTEEAQEKTKK